MVATIAKNRLAPLVPLRAVNPGTSVPAGGFLSNKESLYEGWRMVAERLCVRTASFGEMASLVQTSYSSVS